MTEPTRDIQTIQDALQGCVPDGLSDRDVEELEEIFEPGFDAGSNSAGVTFKEGHVVTDYLFMYCRRLLSIEKKICDEQGFTGAEFKNGRMVTAPQEYLEFTFNAWRDACMERFKEKGDSRSQINLAEHEPNLFDMFKTRWIRAKVPVTPPTLPSAIEKAKTVTLPPAFYKEAGYMGKVGISKEAIAKLCLALSLLNKEKGQGFFFLAQEKAGAAVAEITNGKAKAISQERAKTHLDNLLALEVLKEYRADSDGNVNRRPGARLAKDYIWSLETDE